MIVVDTNVFVGACLAAGASNAVARACLQGHFNPLMGEALFTEYEDVLARSSLFERSRLSKSERSELLDIFVARCKWTRVYFGWRPNLQDEADNHLVELAIAGGASHIIARNIRHVGRMDLKFPHLSVTSPEQFLKEQRE